MNLPQMRALAKYLPSYKSGTLGALRTIEDMYSIQGVMCDIYRRGTKQGLWLQDHFNTNIYNFTVGSGPWRIDCPPEVLEWYGLTMERSNELWVLQASGYNFQQIGKAIEKALQGNWSVSEEVKVG
jgi:hypothetical protein